MTEVLKVADLHIHTHFSDSTSPPEEVVYQAHKAGLSCISISDHDTVDGISPTVEAAKQYDIEVLSGIELSSEANNRDVHILGYGFDWTDANFLKRISPLQNSRMGRMKEMISKLAALGMDDITLEEVCALTESKSVGRPHLAAKLVEKGHVANTKQAFDQYLADGQPGCVGKMKITPKEAIEIIHNAGGVAVLAHPMVTRIDELIPKFVKDGLDGIEVYYPYTADNLILFYEKIARKHGMLLTGGSDAHGKAKKHTFVGKMKVPYELVEKIRERCLEYKVKK